MKLVTWLFWNIFSKLKGLESLLFQPQYFTINNYSKVAIFHKIKLGTIFMFHPKPKIVKWLYEMGRTWELLGDRTTRRCNNKIQNNILSGRQSSWGTDKWIWEGLYFQTFEKTEKIFWFEKCNLFFEADWFRSRWRYFRPGLIRGFSVYIDGWKSK